MASFSGFIRKSPASKLQQFFEVRDVITPDDFDWSCSMRGTELVSSINTLIAGLPDRQQDMIKAELDLLASLADQNGQVGAEQVCAGEDIDIEGLEGLEDILLFLAIEHPETLNRVSVQASLNRRNGGKNWAAYQFPDDGSNWDLDSQAARVAFLEDTIAILELPKHRKRVADWYQTVRTHPVSGEETTLTQATIYVEERAASELGFGKAETLERLVVPKVLEVGVACDPISRIVEICAKGGKKVRDECATAFSKNFAPKSEPPLEVPRRDVNLEILRREPSFEVFASDGIERIEVTSLDFFSAGGGIVRVDKKSEEETVYGFLERRFGNRSPLNSGGWIMLAATLRIILAPREAHRRRTLTITLRVPNTTTLPNKTERDRQFVFDLLERWKILAPPPDEFELINVA